MQVPSLFYGTYNDVAKACRKVVAAVGKGASVEEVAGDACIDSRAAEGLFVLNGPHAHLRRQVHFHCFALNSAATSAWGKSALPDEFLLPFFDWCLVSPGRFTGALGEPARLILMRYPERQRDIARAAVRWWPDLVAEGARYTVGLSTPSELWAEPTTIRTVVARLGVPYDQMMKPLPGNDLNKLLQSCEIDVERTHILTDEEVAKRVYAQRAREMN